MLYAVHIYNCTPMQHLKWKTPSELFYRTKPDLSLIRVLGCGTHVFLPDEIRKNKLSACSELMIFLGYDGLNYRFMRHQAGNVIFVSPHAIFDEAFFPKCPNSKPSDNVQEHLEKESRSPSHSECGDVEGQNDLGLFSPSHPLNPTPGPPPAAPQPP
jgi:hypothetical protein